MRLGAYPADKVFCSDPALTALLAREVACGWMEG
jgi:hypothetical protein